MITDRGFNLVGQMMIGLPESTIDDEIRTAREISEMCGAARIYPTVVFRDTDLCGMTESGNYLPLTLEEIFIYELGGADYAVKDILL